MDSERQIQQPITAPEQRPIRKWYFAANLNALRDSFDQIEVAVKSARAKTSLQPFCLVDNQANLAPVSSRLAWLERSGVSLIYRQAELFGIVRRHFGAKADGLGGHWLRCDIPILEVEDEFVLYTDIDVIFRANLDFSAIRPAFLACAPEHHQDDFSYFNSGVMIMNIPGLRQTRQNLIKILGYRLAAIAPHDDQTIFNAAYLGRSTWLPSRFNWKPYWGFNDDAAIVHFHGPKPHMIRRLLAGETGLYAPGFEQIFQRDPEGYGQYLAEFDAILRTAPPLDPAFLTPAPPADLPSTGAGRS